jgi:hypothetical protein
MAALSIQVPYPVFYDRDGQPLDNGNIYIGVANLDPITNPLQVYYDDALTITASQPLKTSNGYVYRNGTPTQLYVNATDFSITVNDSQNLFVYSFPEATGIIAYTGAQTVEYDPPFAGALTTGYSVADKLEQYVSVKDFGAVGDGVTNDRAAILAAVAATSDKTLFFPAGAYRVNSPITISQKVSWLFEGPTGPLSTVTPTAYILKGAACAGDCLTFTGQSNVLDGLAVIGEVGNTGDGIVLAGNSPYLNRPFATKMGRDGIRIGTNTTGCNVNSFTLINPRCINNLRDGIHISEVTVNANAGSFISPICTQNGRHGFYGNTAALGVTIVTPTLEANTGYGAYLDINFGYIGANVILGGDIEGNIAGNVFEAAPLQTEFVGVSVQGKTINSRAQNGAYVPVLTGGVTAGTATYSLQQGSYAVSGGSVNFYLSITWSGHTGTGQGYINLPVPCYVALPVPDAFPVTVLMDGVLIPAGYSASALVSRLGQRLQLYIVNSSIVGGVSALTVPASGSLYISGSYPLNVPNYNYINYP